MSEARPRHASAPSQTARAVAAAFRGATMANGHASGAVPAPLLAKRRIRARKRVEEALAARGAKTAPAPLRAKVEALVARWSEKDWSEGFDEIERFEMECFAEGELARAKRSGDAGRVDAVLEEQHRAEVVKTHGRIEIRGLQMSERVSQDLDLVYVPLRIEDASQKGEVIRAEGIEIRTVPRLSVPELLARHEHAVLVGAPGSGKTTIVSWVAATAASGKLHGLTGWKESPVPFVVPVRSLRGERLDAETVAEVSCSAGSGFVRRVLEAGRALVLVDGLDEARGGAEALVPMLTGFARAYPGNRVLVTTRPAGPASSEGVEVPGFASTTLLPMDREEVYVFIDRWCLAAEVSLQKDRASADGAAKRAADDLKGRVQNSRPVERLAQTPLMCSVLCIVHRFLGQRIPERRAALYDACTNVLLYEWDRAKFPEGSAVGQLDAQDKKYLLGGVARKMHEAHEAEIAVEDLVAVFAERLPSLNHGADEAEEIVKEIRVRSGMLVERRPGMYAFSHLTFQEYLTAVEIVHAGELDQLLDVYKDRWWHEVIALAAGQPTVDANTFVRNLLRLDESGRRISEAILLAAQCSETAIHLLSSVRHDVDRRLAKIVPPRGEKGRRAPRQVGIRGRAALARCFARSRRRGTCTRMCSPGQDRVRAGNQYARETARGCGGDRSRYAMTHTLFVTRDNVRFALPLDTHPVAVFATLGLLGMSASSEYARSVLGDSLEGAAHPWGHSSSHAWSSVRRGIVRFPRLQSCSRSWRVWSSASNRKSRKSPPPSAPHVLVDRPRERRVHRHEQRPRHPDPPRLRQPWRLQDRPQRPQHLPDPHPSLPA